MVFATGDGERGSVETLFNCKGTTEVCYGTYVPVCSPGVRWIGKGLLKQCGSSPALSMLAFKIGLHELPGLQYPIKPRSDDRLGK